MSLDNFGDRVENRLILSDEQTRTQRGSSSSNSKKTEKKDKRRNRKKDIEKDGKTPKAD